MRDSHGDSETAAVCEGLLTWSIQGINNASVATDYAADSFIPEALATVVNFYAGGPAAFAFGYGFFGKMTLYAVRTSQLTGIVQNTHTLRLFAWMMNSPASFRSVCLYMLASTFSAQPAVRKLKRSQIKNS